MLWVYNITFLLLTLSTICHGDNPGAKLHITERGLKKGVEYLVNNMMSNNAVYELSDVTGSEDIASEDMSYEFTKIRMVQFHHGIISAQWMPETGLHVLMENGNATINCNWKLDSWLIKDSGSSVMTLMGLSISMIMGVRRIEPGVPSIYLLDCQSSVQHVDVKMLGGVSYFFESIKEPIQNVVQRSVNQQLCSSIRNQVKKWDQSFSQLNMTVSLNRFIELDLSLVGYPEISDHYANLGLKGLFYAQNKSHSETAFSPAPMTFPVKDSTMVYIGLSQSSVDSLCSAYFSAGFLTFQVSHMVGSKELTTSALAAYMPEISEHFPNPAPVKIKLSATRSPLVFLLLNNMTVQFRGFIQTNAYPPNTKSQNIFSAYIVASLQGSFSFSEAKAAQGLNLTGSFHLDRFQVEGSKPVINTAKGVAKEKGVQQLVQDVVMPVVNEELARGVFIPSGVLKNAFVSIEKGFAILAADLK